MAHSEKSRLTAYQNARLLDPATGLDAIGGLGLAAMGIFLLVLVVGFIYEWKKGALEWD